MNNATVKEPVAATCRICADYKARLEACVREEPERAAAYALGFGFFLAALPIRRLLGLAVSLVVHLAGPVLIVLGLMKVWEELENREPPR